MKEYDVWQEGYAITGNFAPATFVGSTQAESFREACIYLLKDDSSFNKDKLSVWGCKLFDNEADARESFG